MVTTCVADRLIRGYGSDPAIRAFVDRTELWVVPVANPDGYQHAWGSNRYWRKNRRGTHGVDLNRNFGVAWGGRGASKSERSETYAGTAAFSEPESRALRGEAARIVEALTDPQRRQASQAMLLRFRPVKPDGSVDWDAAHAIAADYGRIDVPVALVWGREDDTLPLASGEKLAREIPGAQLIVVDDARHSVHQEQPLATSAALLRFAARLGRRDRPRDEVGGVAVAPP
jgi:pimeloyl-ACP methyl ester carboxylesterase